jgi:hypothetical protein
MSKVLINNQDLVDIANAIRTKKGTSNTIKPYNMATEISTITPTLQEKTVSPSRSSQIITPDSGVDGLSQVTVNAIPDEYITTTDATAAAADIVTGKTAYVNGSKITGNLEINKYYTGSTEPSSTLGNDGDLYLII